MIKHKPWVRLPTHWIREGRLKEFRWVNSEGAANAAALLIIAPLIHHTNEDTGEVKITYNTIESAVGISRTKISQGLRKLIELGIIKPHDSDRSVYSFTGYNKAAGWSKFPARSLYIGKRIYAFDDFKLRNLAELNALKLYYLFVERRDNDTNLANISYDKISDYTDMDRGRIRTALSILALNGLVHVERLPSFMSEHGVSNAYRLASLDQYRHMGTIGRSMDASVFEDAS